MTTQVTTQPCAHEAPSSASPVRGAVVVGYDGSPSSVDALTWAAAEAGARRAGLRVLSVADPGPHVDARALARDPRTAVRRLFRDEQEAAERRADEGVRRATQVEGGPLDRAVRPEGSVGSATAALLDASRQAALVVIGNRGLSQLAGALLGSAAFSVTAGAACPVVVVRGQGGLRAGPGRPVVVGVDASPGADTALALAADHANLTSAALVVLAAWPTPEPDGRPEASVRAGAADRAEAARERALSLHPDLEVTTRVVRERPAPALVAASGGAGLVVVGARGAGNVHSLQLGSVSHATVHGSRCPVAVVRATHSP